MTLKEQLSHLWSHIGHRYIGFHIDLVFFLCVGFPMFLLCLCGSKSGSSYSTYMFKMNNQIILSYNLLVIMRLPCATNS
jgi:hypothetical protein